MSDRILVTPRSAPGHPALDRLTAAGLELVLPSPGAVPTIEQQRDAIAGCVGYLAGIEPIPREVIAAGAPTLRVISRNGTGADAVDHDAAREWGVRVMTAPAANAQGVAELAIALMLTAARSLPPSIAGIGRGEWVRVQGIELAGRTLGLIGAGQIGRRVARIALAFGMRVRAYDAYPDPQAAPEGDFAFGELEEVLAAADVVSLHCPPSPQPLIDAAALRLVPEGAILVNTARAGLVDDDAVHAALESGRLRAYACDVFDPEPPGTTALIRHPRFVGTAHLGGYTRESVERAMTAAADNLLNALGFER